MTRLRVPRHAPGPGVADPPTCRLSAAVIKRPFQQCLFRNASELGLGSLPGDRRLCCTRVMGSVGAMAHTRRETRSQEEPEQHPASRWAWRRAGGSSPGGGASRARPQGGAGPGPGNQWGACVRGAGSGPGIPVTRAVFSGTRDPPPVADPSGSRDHTSRAAASSG